MDRPDLDELRRRRDSLIAQIERDFAGVSREGGVSISEAYALDDWESDEVCAAARASDTYSDWKTLDVAKLDPCGIWHSFMDPIGVRFHLPAYLCFTLRHGLWQFGPTVDSNAYASEFLFLLDTEWTQQKYALLTAPQRRCVARYLSFQAEMQDSDLLRDPWIEVLAFWIDALPTGEQRALRKRWPQLRA